MFDFLKNYINSSEICKINKIILQKCGNWLDQSFFNWKILTGTFCHLFLNLVPKMNYMRKALARSEFKGFAKCFPESIIIVFYLVENLILYFDKRHLKNFFNQLEVDWNGK